MSAGCYVCRRLCPASIFNTCVVVIQLLLDIVMFSKLYNNDNGLIFQQHRGLIYSHCLLLNKLHSCLHNVLVLRLN